MWQPEPHWVPVSGGSGPSTVGVWRVDRSWIVKRVNAPSSDEAQGFLSPTSPSYWRREAEFALACPRLSGVSAPDVHRIDEDDEGYTLWSSAHDRTLVESQRVAQALAELAATDLEPAPWHATGHLRAKVAQAEQHDGWPTLARTTIADLADAFWSRRRGVLERLAVMPQVPSHGDLVQANVLTVHDAHALVIDWGSFGWSAPGEDLGLYALSAGCDLERMVWHYTDVGTDLPAYEDVLWAARAVIAFTVFGRAEWVLARVAPGEGALANKYRHPAVAPYLRALQNQIPTIEAVLAS
ncbi:MAG: phosphotransferase [Marmoricola sp.]